MRTVFTLCLTGFLSACPGPNDCDPRVELCPGSWTMTAGWRSVIDLTTESGPINEYFVVMDATQHDDGTVLFESICPDYSGSILATLNGTTAKWDGNVVCNIVMPDCHDSRVTFTHSEFTAFIGGKLEGHMNGALDSCGASLPIRADVQANRGY